MRIRGTLAVIAAAGVVLAGCTTTDKDSAENVTVTGADGSTTTVELDKYAFPVEFTDCKGENPITFDAPPTKIITSNNAGADLLARLDAGPQVLGAGWAKGLDSLDADVRGKLQHVKRLSDGNVDKETLLTQGGDVFLATFESMEMMGTTEPSAAEFKQAGMSKIFIKSSACAKHMKDARTSLDQVYEDITALATLTGHPKKGEEMVAAMKKTIEDARKSLPADAKPSIVHIDVAASKDQINTPGATQIAHAIYSLAGFEQPLAAPGKQFGKISYEQLVAADPDWISVAVRRTGSEEGDKKAQDDFIEKLKSDPRTKDMKAVKEGRFLRVTSENTTLAGPANADIVAYAAKTAREK